MSPFHACFWITIVLNVSVMQALFALIAFYETMKSRLAEFDPLLKFLCVKAIIVFAFWQGLAIMIFVRLGVITSLGPYEADVLPTVLQDLLICLEMPLIALAHRYAFPVDPFLPEGSLGNGVDSGYVTNIGGGQRNLDSEFGTMNEPLMLSNGGLFGQSNRGHQSMMLQSTRNINPFADEEEIDRAFDDPLSSVRGKATMSSTWGSGFHDFFRRNFAYNEAIRDFNSSMPVLTIPSGFVPAKGESVPSHSKWRTDI